MTTLVEVKAFEAAETDFVVVFLVVGLTVVVGLVIFDVVEVLCFVVVTFLVVTFFVVALVGL